MFNSKGKFLTLVLAVIMVLGSFTLMVQATPEGDVGHDFDQMLEQMRSEFFSPARSLNDSERTRVYLDVDDIPHHTPLDFSSPDDDDYVGIVPHDFFDFVVQDYQEGSTRLFRAQIWPGSPIAAYVQGSLVRQGDHVNIWVLDPDAYKAALGPAHEQLGIAGHGVLTDLIANTALLDDMATRFDGIVERMTQGFGAFAGVRVTTSYFNRPYVGDIHHDGRVNVLLYDLQGGSVAGFFDYRDYNITGGGNTPIALMHVRMTRGILNDVGEYLTRPTRIQAGTYYTFAHELQHLLFHMHLGVYLANQSPYTWFNEALSDYAAHFYTAPGVEFVQPWATSGTLNAARNSYVSGDFVNFRNRPKSYAMGRLYATLMHRMSGGSFASDVYAYFNTAFPSANTPEAFTANRNQIINAGMPEVIGNALSAAGLTGSTGAAGEDAFALVYFMFMENFAADGGDVIRNGIANTTIPFHTSNFSALRFWGIRPMMGVGDVFFQRQIQVFLPGGHEYNMMTMTLSAGSPQLPTLASGATVSMQGYGANIPQGATHERVYRLIGESEANPVLTISINDNDPRTQFYVIVPNDAIGAPSNLQNMFLGSAGGTVYPLTRNNAVNIIDTGGQAAYLFVATLFRNVPSATVTYSWGSDTGPTPTPTPTPVDGVTSWAELREAVNAAPEGVPIVIPINNSFAAPIGVGTWWVGNEIVIPRNRHITLVSSNVAEDATNVRILTQENRSRNHFTISGGNTSLTLCQNITLSGGEVGNKNASGGVSVSGVFIMNSGSVIENRNGGNATAVSIGNTGHFVMRGGIIRNNLELHSSVSVGQGAYFSMLDGIISNNSGIGVSLFHRSEFTMYNGTISDNTDTGVWVGGFSTFTMSGGSIRGNTSTNRSGGVYVHANSVFNMTHNNARIENNHAIGTNSIGGGIEAFSATINISAGIITGNSASRGGGVHISDGTFNMTGGSISNNYATYNGGGIYTNRADHSFSVHTHSFHNLNIGPNVMFYGNTAGNGWSSPPINRLAHIAVTSSVSTKDYALNNYDINYTGRMGTTDGVNSWSALRDAINAAPESEPYTIHIYGSFAAPPGVPGHAIAIPANRHITLVSSNTAEGAANVRILTQANSGQRHFWIHLNSSITLCQNITLSGGEAGNLNNSGGINVNSTGHFIMNPGSAIENCRGMGAVSLNGFGTEEATQARFTMSGGVIRYSSTAVSADTNSLFVMGGDSVISYNSNIAVGVNTATSVFEMKDNATIRDNTLGFHPLSSAVTIVDGIFIMRGGSIVNNKTYPAHFGTGVSTTRNSNARFTMYGGTISNHISNGVLLLHGSMIMNGGEISHNIGSGVTTYGIGTPTFTMNGGTISNNTDSGVTINRAGHEFTMTGGLISNNSSRLGAGIDLRFGVFAMSGGTISNNTATETGGGIRLGGGTAYITGGVITGNSASWGGGIYAAAFTPVLMGVLNMTGGSITNNVATFSGGGIGTGRALSMPILPAHSHDNLSIGPDVFFVGNTAGNGWSAPPDNRLPHIAAATASIWDYVLNNYDIYYTARLGQEPLQSPMSLYEPQSTTPLPYYNEQMQHNY